MTSNTDRPPPGCWVALVSLAVPFGGVAVLAVLALLWGAAA